MRRIEEIAKQLGFVRVEPVEAFPALAEALSALVENDAVLLNCGAHERAICHRLALYLESAVNRDLYGSNKWNIDCEYNIHGSRKPRALKAAEMRKALWIDGSEGGDKKSERTVFPDIIVHRRHSVENHLVVEVKLVRGSPDSTAVKFDLTKLKAFEDPDNGFGYRHALFVAIATSADGSAVEVGVFSQEGGDR